MIRRKRQVGLALAVLLLFLLATAGYIISRAYLESKQIKEYVGGPFSSQLLYLQGCTAAATGNDGQEAATHTLEEQIDLCRRTASSRAGYYVYDFNIKRSVALSKKDLELWRKYAVLSFPDSLGETVRNSETNEFNRIIPFEEFQALTTIARWMTTEAKSAARLRQRHAISAVKRSGARSSTRSPTALNFTSSNGTEPSISSCRTGSLPDLICSSCSNPASSQPSTGCSLAKSRTSAGFLISAYSVAEKVHRSGAARFGPAGVRRAPAHPPGRNQKCGRARMRSCVCHSRRTATRASSGRRRRI